LSIELPRFEAASLSSPLCFFVKMASMQMKSLVLAACLAGRVQALPLLSGLSGELAQARRSLLLLLLL